MTPGSLYRRFLQSEAALIAQDLYNQSVGVSQALRAGVQNAGAAVGGGLAGLAVGLPAGKTAEVYEATRDRLRYDGMDERGRESVQNIAGAAAAGLQNVREFGQRVTPPGAQAAYSDLQRGAESGWYDLTAASPAAGTALLLAGQIVPGPGGKAKYVDELAGLVPEGSVAGEAARRAATQEADRLLGRSPDPKDVLDVPGVREDVARISQENKALLAAEEERRLKAEEAIRTIEEIRSKANKPTVVPDPDLEKRGFRMVELPVAAIEDSFRKQDIYLGPGEGGPVKPGEMKAGKLFVNEDGSVDIGDGRHRFAAQRDAGAQTVKAMLDEKSIANARLAGLLADEAPKPYQPQKTRKAYKLFRVDPKQPGKLFPLYVNSDKPVPLGEWVKAETGPLHSSGKGVASKIGQLAYRPGWHAGAFPMATHIGGGRVAGKPTYREPWQVWAEVDMPDDVDWQAAANSRARLRKDGTPDPKTAHITDEIPFGGNYRYKTNSSMTGDWIISGDMRVNRILDDDEVARINAEGGVADLPRNEPFDRAKYGFAPNNAPSSPADESRAWVNIGLQKGPKGDKRVVDPAEARFALERRGITLRDHAVIPSNTEPTLVAQMSRGLTAQEAEEVARELSQEAIAQRVGDVGQLYGPKAEAWGPFNPDYFIGNIPRELSQARLGQRTVRDPFDLLEGGNEYPPVTPAVKAYDKKKDVEYIARGNAPEIDLLMKKRAAIQKDIEEGKYSPYFNPDERYDVDASQYEGIWPQDTISATMPKKQATIDKHRATIKTPEARERLRAAYQLGKEAGGNDGWYKMGQLERKFIDELGPEEGRKRFADFFANSMAATTAGNDPTANLILAGYVNFMRSRGIDIPEGAYALPSPTGGRYLTGNIRASKTPINPADNPKRSDFYGNFLGRDSFGTIDEQMTNIITPGLNAPKNGTYFAYQELIQEVANELGVPARELQEVAWGGTKLQSSGTYKGKPMIQIVNEAIERTSRMTGMTPDEVVRGFIHGNKMLGFANTKLLAGIGGAGLLGAWAMSKDDVEEEAEEKQKKRVNRTQDLLEEMGE